MEYLWAKYEGSHFLDHVPPLTRSRKKGALKSQLSDGFMTVTVLRVLSQQKTLRTTFGMSIFFGLFVNFLGVIGMPFHVHIMPAMICMLITVSLRLSELTCVLSLLD